MLASQANYPGLMDSSFKGKEGKIRFVTLAAHQSPNPPSST